MTTPPKIELTKSRAKEIQERLKVLCSEFGPLNTFTALDAWLEELSFEPQYTSNAIAQERERCAKIADDYNMLDERPESYTARDIARAIRSGA